ncbi:hypothetical protein BOX15_Mlig006041g3 [Macrostomum lignano]|uniref:Innexin n=1 Tax=Macrostomum lignano TaxID=282301 RepID=A0A267DF38_9PLAT|nr:hypothetical protein BOX15_Mlig006041g3 [Macrostomum lignano]
MDTGFFDKVKELKFTSRKHRISDEDAVDRINSYYTPIIIIFISTIIGTKMYLVGDPVQCWIPPEFKDGWEQFAENYCWVKNTYYVPENESIPSDKLDRSREELTYYQWVPFVLALQALLFYLPSAIWKLLNWQSGIHISDLVSTALNCLEDDKQKRQEKVALLTRHIELTIVKQRTQKYGLIVRTKRLIFRILFCGYTKTGNYLTMMYLGIKLLFIANVVGQFFLLNSFLGTDYKFYGWEVLNDLINNRDWHHTGHFPRVTLCDFDIRVLGNMHPRTLQCVLVVNLFNEKAYIFLWFLFVFVSIITIVDAIAWFLWTLLSKRRYATIKKYITPADQQERRMLRDFLEEHLRADGAFVLRIISKNAGDPVVSDVVKQLWDSYRASPSTKNSRPIRDNDYADPMLSATGEPNSEKGTFV